ncbi:MAG: hypothetical protein V1909_01985 [Candidatus Micrarchaeota archaeon]
MEKTFATSMHLVSLSVGVLSIGVALYLFLSIAYPFVAPYSDSAFGNLACVAGGLIFGAFGCYLSWESIIGLEDKKVARKISRKRKKKFIIARAEERELLSEANPLGQ